MAFQTYDDMAQDWRVLSCSFSGGKRLVGTPWQQRIGVLYSTQVGWLTGLGIQYSLHSEIENVGAEALDTKRKPTHQRSCYRFPHYYSNARKHMCRPNLVPSIKQLTTKLTMLVHPSIQAAHTHTHTRILTSEVHNVSAQALVPQQRTAFCGSNPLAITLQPAAHSTL